MLNSKKQRLIGAAGGALAVMILGVAALSYAQSNTSGSGSSTGTTPAHNGVSGIVTAVSGNTITITGKDGTTYTVNAGSATITKDETVSVSDIKTGDTIMANGTVSGTSVTATNIHDGVGPQGMGGAPGGWGGRGPGMGIRGTVQSVSGTTLIVSATNPQDSTTQTYTVDASSAQVMIGGTSGSKPTTGSLTDVKTGDTVMVAGTVSDTSVIAKTIVDGQFPMRGQKPAANTTTTTTTQ